MRVKEYKTGRNVDLYDVRTQCKILAYAIYSVINKAPARWELEHLRARKVIDLEAETDPVKLREFVARLARSIARGNKELEPQLLLF